MVGDDEHRMFEGRRLAPPPHPRLVGVPRPRPAAEHAASHDGRAGVRDRLTHDLVVLADRAALHAVRLPPRLELDHPLVQVLAAPAQRLLARLIRPGYVTVQGHADVEANSRHDPRLSAQTVPGPRGSVRPDVDVPDHGQTSLSATLLAPTPHDARSRGGRLLVAQGANISLSVLS